MKENLPIDIDALAVKAFMFSFLCHLLVFRLFIITFNTPPIPLRPSFVFLGSILPKTVLSSTYTQPANAQPSLNISQFLLREKTQRAAFVPNATSPVKPVYTSFVQEGTKTTLKSNFEPQQDLQKQEKLDKILGIETKTQPFVPLRLNPYD